MSLSDSAADYAVATAPHTVRIQRRLPGPIDRVWAYLTESDKRRKWLASGDMPADVGAPFALTWRNDELTDPPGHKPDGFGSEHSMDSTVTAFDAPRHVAFTWGDGEVSITLEPQGSQVLLTLVHTAISDRRNQVMIGAGWHTHLDVLAARLAGSQPTPFWDGWLRLRDDYDRLLTRDS
jgi:uncharacterized protein YndB with AHSA1/START domain